MNPANPTMLQFHDSRWPAGSLADSSVVPVVVAKCGLFLKETATEVEGTFRISGSAKRMRELQAIFDTGPKVSDMRSLLVDQALII